MMDEFKTKICPKCGKKYRDASINFCGKDGSRLTESSSPENRSGESTGHQNYCPTCGETLNPSSDSCSQCGNRLDADATPMKKFLKFCRISGLDGLLILGVFLTLISGLFQATIVVVVCLLLNIGWEMIKARVKNK